MHYQKMCVTGGMLMASLVGGALGSVLLDARIGAQGDDIVTTTQVNIVDASGQLRATLTGRDERGMAALSFYDADGQARGIVGLDGTGSPVLRMLTAAGESRLLAVVQDDDALLIVGDEANRTALVGSVGGGPVVSLGEGRVARARLQLDQSGAPFLALFDTNGQRAASMVVDPSDSSFLTLYERGRARVTLGATQGNSLLNLSDQDRPRLIAGVAADGNPSVTFLDADGGPVALLPTPQ